jgi:hypothetical protein
MLTTECLIADRPKDKGQAPSAGMGDMGGMGM